MQFVQIVSLLALAAGTVVAQCGNPVTRMEWNQLSNGQKQQYIAAIQQLGQRPASGQTSDATQMSLGDFTNTHSLAAPWSHGSAEFYPYHRAMMNRFDQALQSVGWSAGPVYLDWPSISQNWWQSDLFSGAYLGSPSSSDSNHCVVDGVFKNGAYSVSNLPPQIASYRNFPNPSVTCLRRCGYVGSATVSASEINARFAATSYASFRGDITSGPNRNDDYVGMHMSGHIVLGGDGSICDMGNGAVSTNDPLFWFHHSYVDKVWWKWQNRCPAFKFDYEGPLTANDIIDPTNSGIARADQMVDSWGTTVQSMLDTQSGAPLCYTYSQSGSDLPMPPVTCPPFVGKAVVPDALPTTAAAPGATSDAATPTDPVASSSAAAAATSAALPSPTPIPSELVGTLWMNGLLAALVQKPAPPPPSFGGKVGGAAPAPPSFGVPPPSTAIANANVVFGRDGLNGTEILPTTTAVVEEATNSTTTTAFNITISNATVSNFTISSNVTVTNFTISSNATLSNLTTVPVEPPHFEITSNTDNTTSVTFLKSDNATIEIPSDRSVYYVYQSYVETVDTDGKFHREYVPIDAVEYVRIEGAPVDVKWNHPCYKMQAMATPEYWIKMHGLNRQLVKNSEAKAAMRVDKWNVENCGPVVA
ncbi:hypothetical protein HDU98_003078 [Podochytrium sp. JEL0797]|nr:hypothetical protein HDU98_003078 [Podochytrium sp. JEL0797]